MSYRYTETSRELRDGDIKGAVEIYGSRAPSSLAARAFTSEPWTPAPRSRAAEASVAPGGAPAPAHRQKALGLDTADR